MHSAGVRADKRADQIGVCLPSRGHVFSAALWMLLGSAPCTGDRSLQQQHARGRDVGMRLIQLPFSYAHLPQYKSQPIINSRVLLPVRIQVMTNIPSSIQITRGKNA